MNTHVVIHARSVGEFEREYFFSTDHLQRIHSPDTYPKEEGWVPTTHYLPQSVVPRDILPSGRVETLEELLLIFYPKDRSREIPNPDPTYQP